MATNGNASAHDPSTEVYEAIYAYEATDPSDLSFDVGERIVVSKREGDWWTGQVGDRTGTFPYNYVQKIDHANVISLDLLFISIASYRRPRESMELLYQRRMKLLRQQQRPNQVRAMESRASHSARRCYCFQMCLDTSPFFHTMLNKKMS